jgi:hypothetical protein
MVTMVRVLFPALLLSQVFWNAAAIDAQFVRRARREVAADGTTVAASSSPQKEMVKKGLVRKADKVVAADGTIVPVDRDQSSSDSAALLGGGGIAEERVRAARNLKGSRVEWQQSGDREFMYVNEYRTWSSAESQCVVSGGHLAKITSADQNSAVHNLVGSKLVWIGASDSNTEGQWKWSDGTSLGYDNWMSKQPNNYNPSDGSWECSGYEGQGEDCATMGHWSRTDSSSNTGTWNDVCCGGNPPGGRRVDGYVCSRDIKIIKASCTTLAACPAPEVLRADAATLTCEGATCNIATDAATCCEPVSYQHFHCAARVECVDDLQLRATEFVNFQCECIETFYEEYVNTRVWPAATTKMCKDFVQCLSDQHSMAAHLVAELARAMAQQTQTPTLIERTAITASGKKMSTSQDCFNPSHLSYAALVECQCLQDLLPVCGDPTVEDAEGCLYTHACGHNEVCDSWKALNCPQSNLQIQARSNSSRQESTHVRELPPISDKAILACERKEIEALRERSSAGASAALVSVDAALETTLQAKCA